MLALVGLASAIPLFLLFALAIALSDRGPVLFLQERSGFRGRVFMIYKFRTMARLSQGRHVVSDIGEDARITRVGKLLRATAMDELPVLLNILRGELSFVGPKPLYPRVEWPGSPERGKRIEEIPGFQVRSLVRPGLTGMAQLYAPKNATYEEKFRYDVEYIRQMRFFLDVKLFFLSWWITIHGGWGRQRRKP